jgi:hypothetical protein
MLQCKDISKIQELKLKFKNNWLDSNFLLRLLDLIEFHKIGKRFNICKQSGISFTELMSLLLVLPILGYNTIHNLTQSKFGRVRCLCKDSFYRLLANQKINWRSLLLYIAKAYISKEDKFTPSPNSKKCMVFDDTDIEKTGKTIEGISKVFNHVSKKYIFGFKLFVAGYWNGSIFIPVDFSFHRENKNNNYGLTKKQLKNQTKTKRDIKSKAYKRYTELTKTKTDMLLKMFSRIIKKKIEVEYVLIDSWFTSISLIKKLQQISMKVNVIGMYKYNSKIQTDEEKISLKEYRITRKKPKRCRKLNYYYHRVIAKIDGVKVLILFSKKGVNGKWHTILSTDTSLSFIQAMEIYGIRWTIEVFFKETKQILKLGKCQSTNFDVHIAQTTITFIQYILLSIQYRIEAYETIGGLFRDLKDGYVEYKLNERIFALINEIIQLLEDLFVEIDLYNITSQIINKMEKFMFPKSFIYNKN